jgi:NitT/TauT family transport system permease protein
MTHAANSPAFAGVHNATIEQDEAAIQQRRRERARRDRIGALIYPIGMMVVLIAVWQMAALLFSFPPYLLPAPSAIAQAMLVNAAVLIKQSLGTTVEILLGFALSVAVGVPLALAIYLWRPFERAVYPLLISSQAVPKVAVAPLFLVWFGFGLVPKVLIAFLIAFFPVVINTVMGLAGLEREKVYLAQSMGLGPVATFGSAFRHPAINQSTHHGLSTFWDPGSAGPSTRFPTPIDAKALPLPAQDGIWLNNSS